MDVVEGGELPVDDDEVQVALVDRGELVDGLAVLVLDGEPEGAAVGVEVGGGGDEAVALGGGDDALADRGGGFGLGLGHVGADGGAETGADAEDGDEGDAEAGEAGGGVHRASSYPASSTAAATTSIGRVSTLSVMTVPAATSTATRVTPSSFDELGGDRHLAVAAGHARDGELLADGGDEGGGHGCSFGLVD